MLAPVVDGSTEIDGVGAPPLRVRVGSDSQPAHLLTAGQLIRTGRRFHNGLAPAGWLEREIAGDVWCTALYDITGIPAGVVPVPDAPPAPAQLESGLAEVEMCVATWTRTRSNPNTGNSYEEATRRHITLDGEATRCGAQIPDDAELTPVALDKWHLHTNCYNCAYRLWELYGPPGYIRPENGKDFPPRLITSGTP